jgi:hypothetical protein
LQSFSERLQRQNMQVRDQTNTKLTNKKLRTNQ